jgi:hypothetical protein
MSIARSIQSRRYTRPSIGKRDRATPERKTGIMLLEIDAQSRKSLIEDCRRWERMGVKLGRLSRTENGLAMYSLPT